MPNKTSSTKQELVVENDVQQYSNWLVTLAGKSSKWERFPKCELIDRYTHFMVVNDWWHKNCLMELPI